MPKPISRRELIRRFRKLGFTGPISGTRHQFVVKGDLKVRIPNQHKGGSIDWSLIKKSCARRGSRPAIGTRLDSSSAEGGSPRCPARPVEIVTAEREVPRPGDGRLSRNRIGRGRGPLASVTG